VRSKVKTKVVLEYILFFVINLCTVQLSLTSYARVEDKAFSRLVIPATHGHSVVPRVLSSAGMPVNEICTAPVFFMRTDEGVVTQTFNGEEEAQLKRLAAKVGRAGFGELMVQYCTDKARKMPIARVRLMDNEIASK
jgi:hypothetical protein